MAFINSLIHTWRCIVVINDKDNPDTYFRSLFLLHLWCIVDKGIRKKHFRSLLCV